MYLVRYRCAYREYWYEDLETPDPQVALNRAMLLEAYGRTVMVVDLSSGQIVYGLNKFSFIEI